MAEAILSSTAVDTDVLSPSISYGLNPSGSWCLGKREATVFALGSSYSPSSVKMISIPFGSTTEWLVPESVVFSAIFENTDDALEAWPATPDANCLFERITYYEDLDGDGWGADPLVACEFPEDAARVDGDCDDGDPEVSPAGHEVCDELDVDEDCDGLSDDDDPDVDGTELWYEDLDGDGAGNPDRSQESCDPPWGWVGEAGDCDDRDADISPGADDGYTDDCVPEPRNDLHQEEDVCGCLTGGGSGGWGLAVLVLWGRRRRDISGGRR